MHTNSLKAWRECREVFSKRELLILHFFDERKECSFTDREVMKELGFSEPNAVRPRISDLINGNPRHDGGFLEECGDCVCQVTNVTVRLVRMAKPQMEKVEQAKFDF